MNLKIKHSAKVADGKIVYCADYELASGENDEAYIGDWMKRELLGALARQWFLIHGEPGGRDVNAELVNDVTELKLATISSLRQGLRIELHNPVVIAGCDEFVMRACAMAHEGDGCCEYLRKPAQTFDLRELRPSGKALPDVSDEVVQAVAG